MGGRSIAAVLVAVALAGPASAQSGEQGSASPLKLLEGVWGKPDCAMAAPVKVLGHKLLFQWPGRDQVVERVTAVVGNRISATLISPEARRGELYEYEVGVDRLLIRTVASGLETILVRCARPSG